MTETTVLEIAADEFSVDRLISLSFQLYLLSSFLSLLHSFIIDKMLIKIISMQRNIQDWWRKSWIISQCGNLPAAIDLPKMLAGNYVYLNQLLWKATNDLGMFYQPIF